MQQSPGHSAASCTEPCIIINAISPKTTGDLLIVSGTTNFPVGTMFMVMVKEPPGSKKPNTGIGSSAIVLKGTGNANRFSCRIDTSILKPDELLVTVTNWEGDMSKGTAKWEMPPLGALYPGRPVSRHRYARWGKGHQSRFHHHQPGRRPVAGDSSLSPGRPVFP